MKRASKIVLTIAIALVALGALAFGMALLLGADLVRIADALFARYDFGSMYLYFENIVNQALALF